MDQLMFDIQSAILVPKILFYACKHPIISALFSPKFHSNDLYKYRTTLTRLCCVLIQRQSCLHCKETLKTGPIYTVNVSLKYSRVHLYVKTDFSVLLHICKDPDCACNLLFSRHNSLRLTMYHQMF